MIRNFTEHLAGGASIHRQRGVTSLFVTMVVLLVVMLLGITAALLSGTQFRLAGNLQSQNAAFNLAEESTNTASAWLITDNNFKSAAFTTYSSGTPYLYPINSYPSGITASTPAGWEQTIVWSNSNSLAIGGDDTKRYFIQKVAGCQGVLGDTVGPGTRTYAPINRAEVFRITSRGTGIKGTVRFLQTMYTIPISQADIEAGYCGT